MKKNRVQRSKEDLKKELIDQLGLLQNSCRAYDNGLEAIGKHIALSLRVLLHHHGKSRSLLDQLGYRSGRFYDTAGPLYPKNLLASCPLVMMEMSSAGGFYRALVTAGGGPLPPKLIDFVEWWNDPVLKDDRGRTFCRRELVLNVSDTDGGAHVDPDLDEAYMALSRENSLGWMFTDGTAVSALEGRPELACMRQIAHELLLTIHHAVEEYRPYAEPVLPASRP